MKKSTAVVIVAIAFVLGFGFKALLLNNQSAENQGAAAALSTTTSSSIDSKPTPTTQCLIKSFKSNPNVIITGGSSTISWETVGCQNVTVGTSGNVTAQSLNGTLHVGPLSVTTLYGLTASPSTAAGCTTSGGIFSATAGSCSKKVAVVVVLRDICPNIAGAQTTIPVGMVVDAQGNCVASGTIEVGKTLADVVVAKDTTSLTVIAPSTIDISDFIKSLPSTIAAYKAMIKPQTSVYLQKSTPTSLTPSAPLSASLRAVNINSWSCNANGQWQCNGPAGTVCFWTYDCTATASGNCPAIASPGYVIPNRSCNPLEYIP